MHVLYGGPDAETASDSAHSTIKGFPTLVKGKVPGEMEILSSDHDYKTRIEKYSKNIQGWKSMKGTKRDQYEY